MFSWQPEVNESVLCPLDVSRYNEEVMMCAIEGHATLWKCPDIESNFLGFYGELGYEKNLIIYRNIKIYGQKLFVESFK